MKSFNFDKKFRKFHISYEVEPTKFELYNQNLIIGMIQKLHEKNIFTYDEAIEIIDKAEKETNKK